MSIEEGNSPHDPDQTAARPTSRNDFVEIPHLAELATFFGQEIDWEAIDQAPRTNRIFERFRANLSRTQDLASGVHGSIIELHVNRVLKQIQNSGDFPGTFFADPIPNEGTTPNFRFIKTENGGYKFQKIMLSGKLHAHAEVDGLIEVNGVPVVIEVKGGTQGRSITDSIRQERVQKLKEALSEVYPNSGFGYLVVAPSDVLSNPLTQQNLSKRGVGLAKLGATTTDIDTSIKRLATQRNIPFFDRPSPRRRS